MARHELTPNLAITENQLFALAHAAKETGNTQFAVEAYDDEGWLLLAPELESASGAWLAPDGGWHFGPDEVGHYPWRVGHPGVHVDSTAEEVE
jgi:hypothetical protein